MTIPGAVRRGGSALQLSAPRLRWSEAAAFGALLVAMLAGGAASVAAWLALAGWALKGGAAAVRAILFGVLLNGLNPILFPPSATGLTLRWVVLACAGLGVVLRYFRVGLSAAEWKLILWAALYLMGVLLLAISGSYVPLLSFVKLGMFGFAFLTVVLGVRQSQHHPWRNTLYTLYLLLLVPSVMLAATPFGYYPGAGLMGLLGHPQLYGFVLVPPLAWLTMNLLGGALAVTPAAMYFAVLFGWVTLFLSGTRTAVLAGVLSFAAAGGYAIFRRRELLAVAMRGPAGRIRIAIAFLSIAMLLGTTGAWMASLGGFVYKYGSDGTQGGVEQLTATRAPLIAMQWRNFQNSPWTGIGFGIPTDITSLVGTSTSATLGLGAPAAEKGVIVTAVLEETGFVGGVLFVALLVALAAPVFARASLGMMALFASALLVNLGEVAFFAPGFAGNFIWFYLALAAVSESARSPIAGAEVPPRAPLMVHAPAHEARPVARRSVYEA